MCVQGRRSYRGTRLALVAVGAALLVGCSHPPPAESQSPTAAQPPAGDARPAPAPLAGAERAELIELIRRRAEAESRNRAAQPAPTAAPTPAGGRTTDTTAAKPSPPPAVAAQAPQGAQTPAAPAGGPAPTTAKSGCCGDAAATTELVPPPEGSPQPKVACKEPSVKLDSVWKGRPAVFHFEIANTGEAPLQIRLKGG